MGQQFLNRRVYHFKLIYNAKLDKIKCQYLPTPKTILYVLQCMPYFG